MTTWTAVPPLGFGVDIRHEQGILADAGEFGMYAETGEYGRAERVDVWEVATGTTATWTPVEGG